MIPTLSIVVPSTGWDERPGLSRCVNSILCQLRDGDELLLRVDHSWPYGYRARDEMMRKATGDALLFMDDDDVYLEGALDKVRAAVAAAPDAIHVFRMDYRGFPEVAHDVWFEAGRIEEGNVASQVMCVPRKLWLGAWGTRYAGDFDFFTSMLERNPGVEVIWEDTFICALRPHVAEAAQ